jgi:ferrous iron transport protein B
MKVSEPLIVLVGNPNSGKTSLFNHLTGSQYKVANYPGVTVERRQGTLKLPDTSTAQLVDLPGTYSLQGESIDERVTIKELQEKPDLIIAVVDASNIERNLYIVSELIDLKIPMILALNMVDLATKRGIGILNARLSHLLDLPVIPIVALERLGIEELRATIVQQLKHKKISKESYQWAPKDYFQSKENLGGTSVTISTADYGTLSSARYKWINHITQQSVTQKETLPGWSEKIDTWATGKVSGLVIFFFLMALLFQSIYAWAAYPMELIDYSIATIGAKLTELLEDSQLRSLLIDGVLAGVGSVIIFIPQIALLFFFIGILEDSGYLCRAAFVMDRLMRKVGLQGRSFIPLLSSFACAIPGIMSTRSIPSLADRLLTILVAPLMSCSARIPIYTLLIAAFIPAYSVAGIFSLQGLVMLSLYVLGVFGAALVSFAFKKTLFAGEPTLFVMEMPPFRMPSFRLILRDVWDRIKIFLRSAGTIILACSIVLWFLASHPRGNSGEAVSVRESYAGQLGRAIEPIIKPLGYNWEIGVGIIASFAAREVFVSSLATVYNLDSSNNAPESLTKLLKNQSDRENPITIATALSLLVFYVFSCQCMSTLAVCKRETGSWKWPAIMFLYMTTIAYIAAWATYTLAKSAGL